MKVFECGLRNPRVEYLGRSLVGKHQIKFGLDMYAPESPDQTVVREIILEVDEKEMWSIAPDAATPRTCVEVKVKEPDDLLIVEYKGKTRLSG